MNVATKGYFVFINRTFITVYSTQYTQRYIHAAAPVADCFSHEHSGDE